MVSTPPPPMSKIGLKLVCNVNIVQGNLKSENSKDYSQNLNEIVHSVKSASGQNRRIFEYSTMNLSINNVSH
jgi:hypothetical protein